ncbi:sodium:solute symporter [Cyanobium sp. ATX 6A2]|uniref:sodium/glutamate symporter n=1 Tax=Cyanobium sp. ATX 6A2 TaxID=2823700 RepID=UPI0020CD360B|nr:sodium/glutamate symporter [Cyanobium sp. ATX 6A2]MCP9888396.1 sodium:solute symporter [Cyanobium sp. ATX 6A2]
MKLFDVLIAFVALSLLLLLATALRQRWGLLRGLGLPEALVAGLLGLAIGPFSPLRLFPESVYTVWSQTPGVLINVVFASLFIGQTLPSRRVLWQRAASQTAFGMVLGFGQYLVGGLVVLVVLRPLLGTNPLMACLIEVGFEGGHGTAAGMGSAFSRLGLESGEALGLAMATIGVLAGVLVGSALVVIGRRRQWLLQEPPQAMTRSAARPEVAAAASHSATIDGFTLNLALIGGAIGLGVLLRQALVSLAGALGGQESAQLFSALPLFPLAMVGGLLVQQLLRWQGHPRLASVSAQRSIGSLAMDVLIAAAMASLNLPLVEEAWLPLLVLALVGLGWNVSVFLWLGPRLFRDAWFERAIADFGQSTGVTATGLLLLRMADPYGRSPALEAFSFKQLVFEPFLGGGLITAFAPIALVALGLPLWTLLALGLTATSLAFGARMARQLPAGSAAP